MHPSVILQVLWYKVTRRTCNVIISKSIFRDKYLTLHCTSVSLALSSLSKTILSLTGLLQLVNNITVRHRLFTNLNNSINSEKLFSKHRRQVLRLSKLIVHSCSAVLICRSTTDLCHCLGRSTIYSTRLLFPCSGTTRASLLVSLRAPWT